MLLSYFACFFFCFFGICFFSCWQFKAVLGQRIWKWRPFDRVRVALLWLLYGLTDWNPKWKSSREQDKQSQKTKLALKKKVWCRDTMNNNSIVFFSIINAIIEFLLWKYWIFFLSCLCCAVLLWLFFLGGCPFLEIMEWNELCIW